MEVGEVPRTEVWLPTRIDYLGLLMWINNKVAYAFIKQKPDDLSLKLTPHLGIDFTL